MIGEISALSSTLAIASSAVISIIGRITELAQIPLLLMGLMAASTLIGLAVGDTLYLRVMNLVEVSKLFPAVRGSQILFTMFVAALVFGEEVTWATGLGAILVMGGVYLAAFARTEDTPSTQAQPVAIRKWLPMAVIAGLCWTTSFSFMKVVLEDIDPIIANSFRLPIASLLLTFLVLRSGQRESLKITEYGLRTLGLVSASGILSYGIGVLLELNAIRYAGIAKATILTSWTPLFVLALSALFLRERLTLRLGFGTLLCSGGTALLMVL